MATSSTDTQLPLTVWQCTHCAIVRNKPCARVCRLQNIASRNVDPKLIADPVIQWKPKGAA